MEEVNAHDIGYATKEEREEAQEGSLLEKAMGND